MLRIADFAKTHYREIKAHLRYQARTGDYWQPRCYIGDPNWQWRRAK